MTKYLKAIFAAAFAGIGATQSAYVAGAGHIGLYAGLTIAASMLTALGVVWGVSNKPDAPAAPPVA